MRIFSWVLNKISGRQETQKIDADGGPSCNATIPDAPKDEFSDWPQSFLAIGTFGNSELKEVIQKVDSPGKALSSPDRSNFTLEEVIKLQKELNKLLTPKHKSSSDGSQTLEQDNAPLDRLLQCQSSSNDSRKVDNESRKENSCDQSPSHSKIILNKAGDFLADNHNALKQRSISFLLKKMFVCKGGFTPVSEFRDPLPESRMEKLFKAILHKKIYPQSSTSTRAKKYLETKPQEKAHSEETMKEIGEDGVKWVKTDSEYIVLEM
ncbi:protein DEEPER ROOTING 1-like [Typha latifolia]|uniref:protein DEEPER ROOTING 1-like n=1 Tax=Typha latifolia TaxID=4733 RepID=UPI003C2FF65F